MKLIIAFIIYFGAIALPIPSDIDGNKLSALKGRLLRRANSGSVTADPKETKEQKAAGKT